MGCALKTPSKFHSFTLFKMTFELATALLNRATNGTEVLAVLDTISADVEQEDNTPTMEEIQF